MDLLYGSAGLALSPDMEKHTLSSEEIARPLVKYLRLPEERTVDLLTWPAGAGKTRAVLQDVIREVREGGTVLWLTPTVEVLQKATVKRLTGEDRSDGFANYLLPELVEQHNVSAADAQGRSVGAALSASLNAYFSRDEREGRVFLASWQGYVQAFRMLQPCVKRGDLRVVIDEVPEIRRQETSYLADVPEGVRWETYLNMSDANNLRMSASPEFQRHWRKAVSKQTGSGSDAVTAMLPRLAECLTAPELSLSTLLQQGRERSYFVMYLRPEVLNIGRSVEILAANAEDSLMFKIYSECGIHFRINQKYTELARLNVANGESFTIAPLQERRLSKNQFRRDEDLPRMLVTKAAQIVRRHFGKDERFIFCLPADIGVPTRCPATALSTKTVLSGSNEYKEFHAAAFLAALNMEDIYAAELRDRWGLSRAELDAALGAEACYQYAMRLKGRHGRKLPGEKYLVLVGGMDMAVALQRKIPGSVIDASNLTQGAQGHEVGKRGMGLLGSLAERLTKAQKGRLTGYCRSIAKEPQRNLTRCERKGLSQVAAALGKDEARFQADFLRVARGEANGQVVFTAAEYRHGF